MGGGELEEALEAFAEILLNNPVQIEAYVGLANTHEQLENPWAAERSWRRVVELQPTMLKPSCDTAMSSIKLGEPKRLSVHGFAV